VTKIYAICDRKAYEEFKDNFCPMHGSHYIDLPSGRLLVLGFFHKEENEIAFAVKEGVEILPDPFFSSSKNLEPSHIEELRDLGVSESSTILDVGRAAAARHPLMKLRAWY
jgi:hypothetical protein